MTTRFLLVPAALTALLLAGCGGSGGTVGGNGGGGGGGATTFAIPFTNRSADLTADGSEFRGSTSTWNVAGKRLTASLEGGSSSLGRRLAIDANSATPIVAGTVIGVGGATDVRYTETTRAGGDEFIGADGTITVTNLTDTDITLKFDDVTMTAKAGTAAKGSFKINGTYVVKRIRVSVGNGSVDINLAGSANVGLGNFKLSNGGTNVVTLTGVNAGATQILGRATQGGLTTKDFAFNIFAPTGRAFALGDRFTVNGDASGAALTVLYTQVQVNTSNPQASVYKIFTSANTSGTVEVVGLTADGIVFKFTDVKMEATNTAPSVATGSFTINGTFGGKLVQP